MHEILTSDGVGLLNGVYCIKLSNPLQIVFVEYLYNYINVGLDTKVGIGSLASW